MRSYFHESLFYMSNLINSFVHIEGNLLYIKMYCLFFPCLLGVAFVCLQMCAHIENSLVTSELLTLIFAVIICCNRKV